MASKGGGKGKENERREEREREEMEDEDIYIERGEDREGSGLDKRR